MTPGKGSKFQKLYDLSGRITCMLYAKRRFSHDEVQVKQVVNIKYMNAK